MRAFVAGVSARESSPKAPPAGRRQESVQNVDGRGLPRPVLAEQPKTLPRRTLKFIFSKTRRFP